MLAVILLARAVTLNEHTPDLDLVPILGKGFLGLADDEEPLYGSALRMAWDDVAQALDNCPRTRCQLVRYLLQHSNEDRFVTVLTGIPGGSFLPHGNFLHWMEHWDELTAINPELARYAVRFPSPEDARDKAQADAARHAHPTLADATASWSGALRSDQ
ncbi:hypothetical protein [Streptomyces sp. NPDC004230]